MTILKQLSCHYIYGLSATPEREDGLGRIVYMYCGPVRYKASENDRRRHYEFSQILVPRFTNAVLTKKPETSVEMNTHLMHNQERNWQIAKDLIREYRDGSRCIVLSERKEHLTLIKRYLDDAEIDGCSILTSSAKVTARKEVLNVVRNLEVEEPYILMATSQLLGEGFDVQSLNCLFLVLPISGASRIIQYTGRIERNHPGKNAVKVYDYVDEGIDMALHMYHKRLTQYRLEGYALQEDQKEVAVDRVLFEHWDYEETLLADLKHAEHSILFFVSSPVFDQVQRYQKLLMELHEKGISLMAVLTAEYRKTDCARYLSGAGVQLIYRDHRKSFIIIDDALVWNLSFDFFGNIPDECFATRMKDSALIRELMEIMNEPELEGLFALE